MKKALLFLLAGVMVLCVSGYAGAAAPASTMIRIGTASMTGNNYVQGSVIAQMIRDKMPGFQSNAQATGGSGENCYLLQDGEIELALIQSATAKEAVTGTGTFTDAKMDILRGVGVVVINEFHVIVNNRSNIKHPSDLKGKKVGVAPMGGGVEINANIFLGEFGVGVDEYEHIYSTMGEALEMVKLGQVDAVIYATSHGNANVYDTLSAGTCSLLSISQEDIKRITAVRDEFGPGLIPKGTYPDVPDDVAALSGTMLLLTRESADEESIYQVTKALYENLDYLVSQNAALKDVIPQNATAGMCVPFHPGAERYLKEAGVLK